jgi:isoaspartyl peptidase/L-asparaginase-like protein (Ntn-hydrolase superfamily)
MPETPCLSTYAIVVHGGTTELETAEEAAYRPGCHHPVEAAWNCLATEKSTLTAVETDSAP